MNRILASDSETWAHSATGFRRWVTAVTTVTTIKRIDRRCAESAPVAISACELTSNCALDYTAPLK
jgi:hypothetical protein